jgi:hypothetical protein
MVMKDHMEGKISEDPKLVPQAPYSSRDDMYINKSNYVHAKTGPSTEKTKSKASFKSHLAIVLPIVLPISTTMIATRRYMIREDTV